MLAIPLRPQMFQGYIKFHASHFALGWLIPFSSCHANKSVVTTQSPHSRHLAICTKLKLNRNDSVRLWWNSFLAIFMSESFIFFFQVFYLSSINHDLLLQGYVTRGSLCLKSPATRFMRHSLHWRHNGCDGISNHQPHDCLLYRLFGCRSKKTSKLRVTGLCVGNSPGTGEFPARMASNAENFSIWWRCHVFVKKATVFLAFFVGKSPVTGWFVTQKANNVARNVSMAWSMTSSRESESFTYFAFFAICRWHDMLTGGKNPALSSCSRKSCKIVDFFLS